MLKSSRDNTSDGGYFIRRTSHVEILSTAATFIGTSANRLRGRPELNRNYLGRFKVAGILRPRFTEINSKGRCQRANEEKEPSQEKGLVIRPGRAVDRNYLECILAGNAKRKT